MPAQDLICDIQLYRILFVGALPTILEHTQVPLPITVTLLPLPKLFRSHVLYLQRAVPVDAALCAQQEDRVFCGKALQGCSPFFMFAHREGCHL